MSRATAIILSVGCVVMLAGIWATGVQLRDASCKVVDLQAELAETRAKMDRLIIDTDQLHVQLREVEMLYAVFEKTDAGDHIVSTDGRIEMFTWHDPDAGAICAHWCARQDPGGPCLPSGPDRCIP